VTVGGDESALDAAHAEEAASAKEVDPLARFGLGGMPECASELLEAEQPAFEALRDAKRAKASELQIEGYKVAQNRSLAEVVRRCPQSIEALRGCWGFGGSGVRVEKYGAMFLEALRPHVAELCAVHAAAREEYEAKARAAEGGEDDGAAVALEKVHNVKVLCVAEAAATRVAGRMPERPCDLTAGAEEKAYEALIAATHARAEETGEGYVWNIAMMRSLCEMVRRVPTTTDELRRCWGLGGKGLRVHRHGEFLLHALAPHVPALLAGAAADSDDEDDDEVDDEDRPLCERRVVRGCATSKVKVEPATPAVALVASAKAQREYIKAAAAAAELEAPVSRQTRASVRTSARCKSRLP